MAISCAYVQNILRFLIDFLLQYIDKIANHPFNTIFAKPNEV